MNGEQGSLYREGKISRKDFWDYLQTRLHIDANRDELETEWIDGYDVIEGMRELIYALAKHYRIYYLSDNVKERVERINQRYHFLNWFTDGVFSYDVGVRKPGQLVYEAVLSKAKVAAAEAAFIDDKEAFLSPAKAMGMLTILFVSSEKLKHELVRNNIIIV